MRRILSWIGALKPGRFRSPLAGRVVQTKGLSTQNIWLVMVLIGLVIAIVEIIDHYQPHKSVELLFQDPELVREVIMFSILVPIMGGLLLTLLGRTGAERDLIVKELDDRRSFGEKLNVASQWQDLIDSIVRFPKTILPAGHSRLAILDQDQGRFDLVASWSDSGAPLTDSSHVFSLSECQSCQLFNGQSDSALMTCRPTNGQLADSETTRYCLPLISGDALVGILKIGMPNGYRLTQSQNRVLTDLAPEMARAIENAQLHRSAFDQVEATKAERQRIARDLHDTLAQNITFLRLKLDQLSAESTLLEIAGIQQEIERMRDVASEAYLQVRDTLADLHPNDGQDLADALAELANSVAGRADCVVECSIQGQPLTLPTHTQRQVLYICREALNNVEKHAEASNVQIVMDWGEDDLTLSISDDGLGFCPVTKREDKHFGLTIMLERAEEVDGTLVIKSAPDQGTTVKLWLPVDINTINSSSIGSPHKRSSHAG